MENNFISYSASITGIDPSVIALLLVVLAIWTLFWKGWALWLAARRGEKPWFVALLIVNTIGLLEIIYIFMVAKKSDKKELE